MFVQIIHAHVEDPAAARAHFDRWHAELAPAADGWVGTTAGVSPEGGLVAIVRFASEEAASRNSQREEQDRWAAQFGELAQGPITYHDCDDAHLLLAGGSDDAGFVQVIEARATDVDRFLQIWDEAGEAVQEQRPEIIGGTLALHRSGGRFTLTMYFTSEAAAREGERKELTGAAAALDREIDDLLENIHYVDVVEPWLYSPEGR